MGLILLAFLLPTMPSQGARRAKCVNNLKQIGLALHNYHDVYGCFPPAAITDATGKPLLSWRVALLPFLEQQGLYNRLKLDEAWNSPHNLALLGERPMVFACPSDPDLGENMTRYLGLVGPGAFFDWAKGTTIQSFYDGTSNTLAVVEARDAVPWTAPADLTYFPSGPLPSMKSDHPGGFNALFADGSVRFLKDTIPPATLRTLITRNASENTDDQSY
jgi:prepilin-type processing-associated H-X9-DG protein